MEKNKKQRMTAAERKRVSRQYKLKKMTPEELVTYKLSENERRSNLRRQQKAKMTHEDLENYRFKDSLRKAEKKKEANPPAPDIIKLPISTPYRAKQSYGKAMKRSLGALPMSPRKRVAIVKGLAEKVGVNVDDKTDKYMRAESVHEELHRMVKEFYIRNDISYTAPGMYDVMTVWDNDGKKKKLRKYYLTLYLREAHVIFEQCHQEIGFSLFCKLRPENVLLIGDSPKDQCKCMIHENLFYKLDALGIEYTLDFWKDILCDDSPNSNCWLSKCDECKNGRKIIVLEEGRYVGYKQWVEVLVPRNQKADTDDKESNQDHEDENKNKPAKKNEFYKVMRINTDRVQRGAVLEELKDKMHVILNHINTKRIQASEFNRDKADPSKRVLQIDYAMAYTCEYQDEVQSALWGRGSVNLFTAAVTHRGITKTLLFCTNYKNKDKFANGVFLEYLYANEMQPDETVTQEIVWSDGPTSEFKNRYTRKLLETLSEKYNNKFVWKFSATSHGKEVVDGIGGNVKSTVRRKCFSKGKDRIIVEDSLSFANAAAQLVPSTKIIHITPEQIADYKNTDPFKNAKAVNGILSLCRCIMEVLNYGVMQ